MVTGVPFRKTVGDKNPVGKNIVRFRAERHMDQQDLLRELQLRGVNISQPSLSRLEGQKRAAKAEELIALAGIFERSIEELCRPEAQDG